MTETTTSRIEKIEQQLRNALERYEDRLATAKESFMARYEKSPSYAIYWGADRLVETEEQNRLAQVILKVAENKGLLEATRNVIDRAKLDILRLQGMHSGGDYGKVNDLHVLTAKGRFVEDIEGYIEYIDEIVAEQQKEEELIENVTDTTVYALQAQRNQMLKQIDKYNEQEKSVKAQRDKLALQTARQAVTESIIALNSLANDLGVTLD